MRHSGRAHVRERGPAYGNLRALDGVSLTVRPSEIVCLLDHSGCGKSTLLRAAAGVGAPNSGRARHGRAVPESRRRMRDAIRDETVSTHDPEEAMRIADRIVLMRSGTM